MAEVNPFINMLRTINNPRAQVPPANLNINIDALSDAVIRGEYGNDEERKQRLRGLGFDYDAVQGFVDKKLKGKLTQEDYLQNFVVAKPDTEDPVFHAWSAGEADIIPTENKSQASIANPEVLSSPSPREVTSQTDWVLTPTAVVELNEQKQQAPYYTNNGVRYIPNPLLATLLSLFPRKK